jgi:hypothetical protein
VNQCGIPHGGSMATCRILLTCHSLPMFICFTPSLPRYTALLFQPSAVKSQPQLKELTAARNSTEFIRRFLVTDTARLDIPFLEAGVLGREVYKVVRKRKVRVKLNVVVIIRKKRLSTCSTGKQKVRSRKHIRG